ncbi:transposase [Actinoallomurus iriomotensis]|uniref:transposase n=1 Tax=Actinoallomurus iriomotensis TaxID=478107 RepID=UPI003D7F3EA4
MDVQLAAELIERAKAQGVSLVGPDGLLAGITKTVLQAALDTEMTEHLGYEKGERPVRPDGNHRNGHSPKTVLTEVGSVPLQVPRDRAGQFEPKTVRKHARRVEGFDEAIMSLYAKGLTTGARAVWSRALCGPHPAIGRRHGLGDSDALTVEDGRMVRREQHERLERWQASLKSSRVRPRRLEAVRL